MDYLDAGDRVVVTSHIAAETHARIPKPDAAGKHGVIVSNDGWGLCNVDLDDGTKIYAWNGCDLEAEDQDAPINGEFK